MVPMMLTLPLVRMRTGVLFRFMVAEVYCANFTVTPVGTVKVV
jgi:hypothetical protein